MALEGADWAMIRQSEAQYITIVSCPAPKLVKTLLFPIPGQDKSIVMLDSASAEHGGVYERDVAGLIRNS